MVASVIVVVVLLILAIILLLGVISEKNKDLRKDLVLSFVGVVISIAIIVCYKFV